METILLADIKIALNAMSSKEVRELCLRLARYKKENKELVSYLLFFAGNEGEYIRNVQEDIDRMLEGLNRSNNYYSLKGIRKLLRMINKYIKFSGNRQTEAELLIYFCQSLKKSGLMDRPVTSLGNLYEKQIQKIEKAITFLHDDLQFDYHVELQKLTI